MGPGGQSTDWPGIQWLSGLAPPATSLSTPLSARGDPCCLRQRPKGLLFSGFPSIPHPAAPLALTQALSWASVRLTYALEPAKRLPGIPSEEFPPLP